MTYNPNIPQPTDVISESQGTLLTNFTQLNTVFNEDHVAFDDGTAADRGKHNQVTFFQAAGDSTTLANENSLYSKDDGGNTRLFFRQENNGTVIQMTGADPVLAVPGNTFLPGLTAGNILVQWDNVVGASNGDVITFTTAFSAAPFAVFAIHDAAPASGTDRLIRIRAKAAANFTVGITTGTGSGSSANITYMAIGPT